MIGFIKQLKIAIVLLFLLTLITGIGYPLVVTAVAQLFFSHQANGSLLLKNNHVVGSALIGQSFEGTNYFWSRPSATQPFPYNAMASQGSNLGPLSAELITDVKKRILNLNMENKIDGIPIDLVTASGSGLDPDISPYAALYQVTRVATARGLNPERLKSLIAQMTQPRTFYLLGEPRVNVLQLNLALDALNK